MKQTPIFLDYESVLMIHEHMIAAFGGIHGIRDEGLLRSALHQAEARMFGQLLHKTIFDQAAAYMFHIIKNHPFIDGNKRTGFTVALVFLENNNYVFKASNKSAFQLVTNVAEGIVSKAELAETLKKSARKTKLGAI